MAINSVKIKLLGQIYSAAYNGLSGKWEVNLTAPGATSFHQTGGYYPIEATAVNSAGNSTTVGSDDPALGSALRLVVRERVLPVVAISEPGSGAILGDNAPEIIFTLRDEPGGSGIKLETLSLTLDGTVYDSTDSGMDLTPVTNGYDASFTPSPLGNGTHSLSIAVQDNDGNTSNAATREFTTDTLPPTLDVTAPSDGYVTPDAPITVTGTSNDAHSPGVTVSITLNGVDQGAVTVNPTTGAFAHGITLAEGINAIVVTSTDTAGRSSSVTLSVTLDTTYPVFGSVVIAPNPADAGQTMLISVVVT